jgi:hypothetical protein
VVELNHIPWDQLQETPPVAFKVVEVPAQMVKLLVTVKFTTKAFTVTKAVSGHIAFCTTSIYFVEPEGETVAQIFELMGDNTGIEYQLYLVAPVLDVPQIVTGFPAQTVWLLPALAVGATLMYNFAVPLVSVPHVFDTMQK